MAMMYRVGKPSWQQDSDFSSSLALTSNPSHEDDGGELEQILLLAKKSPNNFFKPIEQSGELLHFTRELKVSGVTSQFDAIK
jgi:hypothetical protein